MKHRIITTLQPVLAVLCLLAGLLPVTMAHAAPPTAPFAEGAATTIVLTPTDDARTQGGSPETTFEAGFLWVGHPNVHFSLLKFDLSVLPVDATINAAGLRLYFTGIYTGTNEVEVGRVDGLWDEATLTGSTPVSYTWSGQFQPVTSTGKTDGAFVNWNVTPLVQGWHTGAQVNDGLALRGNGGVLKAAHSKETGEAADRGPKLIINYTLPADDGQPRPDLGDAPDSTNHHGLNNTAYPGGILGQFPTVRDVLANQVAGPRHNNQTMQAWLGDFLSREAEADQGPDQDAPRNNILRNSVTGATADVADNDRGDDGWRNRNLRFFDCERTQLAVRVSKAANATLNRMYLNVWFDGNRDGDWSDLGQCQPNEAQPAQASYEWVVQNYIVDLSAVPGGGSLDFNVLTEKVLNSSGAGRHWMRFSLSEAPAVQPISGTDLPDGRGPHPLHPTLSVFQYGETEDVLQLSTPAGQDGTLEIQKRVITDAEPVEWIDYVTYEIQLRHNGGTQPIQATLRDVLPYPLIVYPTIAGGNIEYIAVESPTGGATPLHAQLEVIPPVGATPPQQVIKWQGTLAPNAEIKFTFQVRVIALCQPNQQTMTFTNRAEAKPVGGALVTAEDSFSAKCIGYDENNIDFEAEPTPNDLDLDDLLHVPVRYVITNSHALSVNLGFFQLPGVTAATTAGAAPRFLERITLAPQSSQRVELRLNLANDVTDELTLPDEYVPSTTIAFCFLVGDDNRCPDAQQYPHLNGELPVQLKARPNDLGDAPDSSNHAGANMAAYPGVQALFPTVFDAATGLPEGPLHRYPRPFHLGQRVSREAEADLGPDQDGVNNLLPAANDPDNDRFDDGTNLGLWNLAHCQPTNLPVQVAIGPQAVNYFQKLGTPGYLNIWIDSNRNGEWKDGAQCPGVDGAKPAVEHIVIDFPINVVGLGVGFHLLNVPTGLVPWNITDQPAWVRMTLSERPANKTLTVGTLVYGDGRGYAVPFKTGETEDYFYRPLAAGGGPDLAVHLAGQTKSQAIQQPDLQAAAMAQLGNFEIQMFRIDYENIGLAPAQNALLEFQIPEKLRDMEIILVKGTDVNRADMTRTADKLSFILPHIEQNAHGSLVLGWYGCITCTVAAASADVEYTANVNITVAGDVDPSNNQSSTTLRGLLSSPIIGAFMDYTDDSCMDRIISGVAVTNRTTVELRGKGQPNQIIAILIGLRKVAEVTSDGVGNFRYTATLPEGLHTISAQSITSPRDAASGLPTGKVRLLVKPSLPYDPMSTCFVASNGRSYSFPILGYSFGATQTGSWFRRGATYQVSVNTNGSDPNQYFKVTFEDILISSLTDDDHDGTFVGQITFPANLQAASLNATGTLGVIVGAAGNESSFSSTISTATDGVITNRATSQPVANASVSALLAQETETGNTLFAAWLQAQSGQPNPQVTGSDGKYSYSADSGLYRIDVNAAGYQPYRSATIDAGTTTLSQNISLSPVVAEATTHTVFVTAAGFTPATLTVTPGSVIEFVNIDLTEHGTVGSNWDSGLLTTGQSYKVKVGQTGTFAYRNNTDVLSRGTVIVNSDTPALSNALFLPLVQR